MKSRLLRWHGGCTCPSIGPERIRRRHMDNTLLVSLSQQLASYRSMDVIANNLANADTTGFKRESMKFQEYVEQATPAEDEKGTQQISFVQDMGTTRDLTQ